MSSLVVFWSIEKRLISSIDDYIYGNMNNLNSVENLEKWLPFLLRAFRIIIPDLVLEDVRRAFLLAYVNSWGFHIPGPDPNSKGVINGVGLYYLGSMFNHSCDPNAAFIARYVVQTKQPFC